ITSTCSSRSRASSGRCCASVDVNAVDSNVSAVDSNPRSMRLLRRIRDLLLVEGGLPLVWLLLTVVALIPVWRPRMLPLLDMPNHLALVRGWHNYSDPEWRIADYYALRIRPVPYFLYYLTIHLLLFAFDIEVANKIYLSAYLILFPLSL